MATLEVANVSTEIWGLATLRNILFAAKRERGNFCTRDEVVAHGVENASSVNWLRAVASVVEVGFRRDKCGTCIAVQFWGADL